MRFPQLSHANLFLLLWYNQSPHCVTLRNGKITTRVITSPWRISFVSNEVLTERSNSYITAVSFSYVWSIVWQQRGDTQRQCHGWREAAGGHGGQKLQQRSCADFWCPLWAVCRQHKQSRVEGSHIGGGLIWIDQIFKTSCTAELRY